MGNFILTENSLTVFYGGKDLTIFKEDAEYFADAVALVKEDKFHEIFNRYTFSISALKKYSKGYFDVEEGKLLVDGIPVPSFVTERFWEYKNLGLDLKGLVLFVRRLRSNPNATSIEDLFSFLSTGNYPITDRGTFIAYKVVTPNPNKEGGLLDIYTRKIDNSPGAIVTMDRKDVTFDRNITCSRGLHFGSIEYVTKHYGRAGNGDVIVNLEISPEDVVSIPSDYNNQKGRCCKYKVLGINETASEILQRDYKLVSSSSSEDIFIRVYVGRLRELINIKDLGVELSSRSDRGFEEALETIRSNMDSIREALEEFDIFVRDPEDITIDDEAFGEDGCVYNFNLEEWNYEDEDDEDDDYYGEDDEEDEDDEGGEDDEEESWDECSLETKEVLHKIAEEESLEAVKSEASILETSNAATKKSWFSKLAFWN